MFDNECKHTWKILFWFCDSMVFFVDQSLIPKPHSHLNDFTNCLMKAAKSYNGKIIQYKECRKCGEQKLEIL